MTAIKVKFVTQHRIKTYPNRLFKINVEKLLASKETLQTKLTNFGAHDWKNLINQMVEAAKEIAPLKRVMKH